MFIRLISSKRRTVFTPIVLLSIFFLIPQGATAKLAVCFEWDGQINVEISHQGVCSRINENPNHEIFYHTLSWMSSLDKHHNFPCKDIAVSLSDLEQNIIPEQGLIRLFNELQSTFFAFPQSLCEANVSEELSPLFPPLNNSIVSSLSSTILLI